MIFIDIDNMISQLFLILQESDELYSLFQSVQICKQM